MIGNRLFRRHFAVSAVVVLAFILAGYVLSSTVMRFATQDIFPRMIHPAGMMARLIDDRGPDHRLESLEHIKKIAGEDLPDELNIVDANGKSLTGPLTDLPPWNELEKPTEPYSLAPIHQHDPKGLAPQPGPPGPGGPHGPSPEGLIRFPGEPAQYLYFRRTFDPMAGHPPTFLLLMTVGSLIGSVLFGVGFALFLLFRTMREKMGLVDSVIGELQRGNLKARFPVGGRLDEMGEAMVRFNQMADEIERLVERLRDIEKSRMRLLQELAHDLRTPIASLSNLLATVDKKNAPNDQAIRMELTNLARREVEYFGRLVEDLLMLAQVSEPAYGANRKPCSTADILHEEIETVIAQTRTAGRKIAIAFPTPISNPPILGDPHLLRRLFRNTLENAASFARAAVMVSQEVEPSGAIRILIRDDGPGLSEAALGAFGERRISRVLDASGGGRLSVGLGSVIMKTVAEVHRGKVSIANVKSPSGVIVGACVTIELPSAS